MHHYCDVCGGQVEDCDSDADEYDPLQDGELEEEGGLFEDWSLEIICNMDDPPAEAFETSYLRARELLEDAGADSAILLLTVTRDGDDLASSVVLSGGYQRIETNYILEILDAHLEVLTEE